MYYILESPEEHLCRQDAMALLCRLAWPLLTVPNSTTKCPKHLGSAVQSKSTLTCTVSHEQGGHDQELLRRQPLKARLDTH